MTGRKAADSTTIGAGTPDLGALARLIDAAEFAALEQRAVATLQGHPQSGLVWKALGIALTMQGKDSSAAWGQASALLPDDAQTHVSLADALLRLGRHEAACAAYKSALVLDPTVAEAHNNLGNALLGLGLPAEAVTSYERAVQLKPAFALAYNNLGNALRRLGRVRDAESTYRRALDLEPGYAEASNNLGNVLLELGQPEAAAASYRRAIELAPGMADAHGNLGNALRSSGRSADAVLSYREAIARRPTFAEAHANLSDALRDLGRFAEAAACSRRALELDGARPAAHNSLGNALLDLGELHEAASSYRAALVLDPGFVEAHVNLGITLRLLGHAAEAAASAAKALECKPDDAAAWVLLAELEGDAGRFAEAESLFDRAATFDPMSVEACAAIAHLRKMTPDDAGWLARAQALADGRRTPREEVYLRYALGKYHDDVGNFNRAFADYARANALNASLGPRFDRERLRRAVDQLIAAHDAAWARRGRDPAGASRKPVFIVGMPRSGTTLAEQILDSHPMIHGAGELPFWSTAAADEPRDAGALGRAYLQLLDRLSPRSARVVDKMPANIWSLGSIHDALPGARIIHMRRHPIDTCLSIYFQHFKSGHRYANDLGDLAHYHAQYARAVRHWRTVLPSGAYMELSYEDLVADPDAWTRAMLEFIGMPWDPRCLEFHASRRPVLTASQWQVRQKINRSSIARWRHYEQFIGPLADLYEP